MSGINEPFQKYIGEKTALYGLGTETKGALLSLEDRFEILGLLDSFREEGELYGKKIVSLSYVVEAGVKLIIVVARPGSCKAIAGISVQNAELLLWTLGGKIFWKEKALHIALCI